MDSAPLTVEESNLSHAWGKAFLRVMARGGGAIMPLVVTVKVDPAGSPAEDPQIRRALDRALVKYDEDDCEAVANTIFPTSLWDPRRPREDLYSRYQRLLPRLRRKYTENRNGLYFQRMIAYDDDHPVNQLEHVISTCLGGNRRRSALQLTLFDPRVDHTHQRQRGFPCLQSVTFAPHGDGELAVTGFYPLQTVFAKAYGNYLGLSRLGRFVAHELDLRFTRMTCVAAVATRGATTKRDLAPLEETVAAALVAAEGAS
jgi:hypothetical protein